MPVPAISRPGRSFHEGCRRFDEIANSGGNNSPRSPDRASEHWLLKRNARRLMSGDSQDKADEEKTRPYY